MEKPAYYSVMPASIRYDERLKPSEKIFYSEITALASKDGNCWASNTYFSNLYHVNKATVSRWVSHLKKYGYITVTIEYEQGTKRISKRIIGIDEKVNTPTQKDQEGIDEKVTPPIDEKVKENNTSINNTSNNNGQSKKPRKIYRDNFEKLWKLYPNKKGNKNHAFESYKKAIKAGTTNKEIQTGILNLIKHCQPKFYPYGSTWFNGQRWQDVYDSPEPPVLKKENDLKKAKREREKFVLYKYSEVGNDLDQALPIIQTKYPEIDSKDKVLRILYPERYLTAGGVENGY